MTANGREQEHPPLFVGEGRDRRSQSEDLHPCDSGILDEAVRRRRQHQRDVGRVDRRAALGPENIYAQTTGDGQHPYVGRAPAGVVAAGMTPDALERLLSKVFSETGVAAHRNGQAVYSTLVTADEDGGGLVIAECHRSEQGAVIKTIRVRGPHHHDGTIRARPPQGLLRQPQSKTKAMSYGQNMKLIIAFIVGITLAGCGSSTTKSANTTKSTTAAAAAPAATTKATDVAPVAPPATASSTASSGAASANSTATSPGPAAATVVISDSTLGKILTRADGSTLYMFTPDAGGKSACTGGCAQAWPSLVGPGTPGAGLDPGDFSTIKRDDASEQVTFYGHPLYTFAGDKKPGDTNGQGSGGKWYAVDVEGNAAGATSAPATTSGY